MSQYLANPRVTFSIIPSDNRVGPDDQRTLIIGQIATGATVTPGTLITDVPRTDAQINALFGASSHLAMIARTYRSVNPVTNLDALPLVDAIGASAAAATLSFDGTATRDGIFKVAVVSAENHSYELDVVAGDTAAIVAGKLATAVGADRYMPFTLSVTGGLATFTAVNKGIIGNLWVISCIGSAPGLTATIGGWTGGGGIPSLTTLFDPITTMRYQTVLWPSGYDLLKIKALLDDRKNVDNNIMDGMAFTYHTGPFATVKAAALSLDSSEMVLITNEPTTDARWSGPHLPEAPDCQTAKIVAAFDLRVEDGVDISAVVATNAPSDQFGGIHTHSLPLFNTPLLNVGMPLRGTGYSQVEISELENHGVTVIGANRQHNAVITGAVVTTWINDIAGNPDNTWKYAEWRRTHGAIREYFQRNCQKEFRQHRLTPGTATVGYAMANEISVRAFLMQLYQELSRVALTVEGQQARTYFDANLRVVLVPVKRQIQIAAKVPMISQLGSIIGTIQYSFETA
jgi:phage tail sheath gpL-like